MIRYWQSFKIVNIVDLKYDAPESLFIRGQEKKDTFVESRIIKFIAILLKKLCSELKLALRSKAHCPKVHWVCKIFKLISRIVEKLKSKCRFSN